MAAPDGNTRHERQDVKAVSLKTERSPKVPHERLGPWIDIITRARAERCASVRRQRRLDLCQNMAGSVTR
jgi:hypothetical protein